MAYNNHEYGSGSMEEYQEYLSSTHGMLKYLMAYNNHDTAPRVSMINTWNV